jgi:hypothetical protein
VTVTTGWLQASVDGQVAVDQRIATDPERFWDHYQAKILPRVYDHVMKVTDNRPLPDKQPFHRDLDVEVWMSEPDFAIGVDEELISSLEALHESLLRLRSTSSMRSAHATPSRIAGWLDLPHHPPRRRGQAGQVRVLFAGTPEAELESRCRAGCRSPTGDARDRDRRRARSSRASSRDLHARSNRR